MLNHFFFEKRENGKYLLTNDFGKYCFINDSDFDMLLRDEITPSHPKYEELEEKLFVYSGDRELFLQKVRETAQLSKSYLFSSTSLFIFVVTNRCNLNCVYCQAKDIDSKNDGMMSEETAKKALEMVFSSPCDSLTIEFQGGEPLVNYPVIKYIVEYGTQLSQTHNKKVCFNLVSNLTLMTQEMMHFFKDNNVSVSTSLDGNREIHNANRPMLSGKGSFEILSEKLKTLNEMGIYPGAIQTTTRFSMKSPEKLINTYIEKGMTSLFLRPLTPLGIAKSKWRVIGYTPEEYTDFYRKGLEYLLKINKEGTYLSEGHAKIFLSKILYSESENYMELRSPCGATLGQMAIYYDGNIYTCDEGRMLAEMGDSAFKIGTINSSFDELINSSTCKSVCASSLLECIPECCDCVFEPYCGTCPVLNYVYDGDIFPKSSRSYRCKIYRGMLSVLFEILERNDSDEINILRSWIEK